MQLRREEEVAVEKATIKSTVELHLDPKDSLFLIGGFDGKSLLATMDLYFTSQNVIKSLKPMSSIRSYASIVWLNGEMYVFGGGKNTHIRTYTEGTFKDRKSVV